MHSMQQDEEISTMKNMIHCHTHCTGLGKAVEWPEKKEGAGWTPCAVSLQKHAQVPEAWKPTQRPQCASLLSATACHISTASSSRLEGDRASTIFKNAVMGRLVPNEVKMCSEACVLQH
mmetsp:Transcript_6332/g.11858  ORF Transcript_6332/g.11858 Transcript_6332/m.11858 type:complete len:119 (+) Transcript_6332:853-1209(+)